MGLDLSKLLNLSYLFSLRPSGLSVGFMIALLVIFVGLIVAAIGFEILKKIKQPDNFIKKLWTKYATCFATLGVIGLLLVWFRQERLSLLGARFWLVVWLLGLAVWLGFIVKYQVKVIPLARKQIEERKMFNKYLPKKRK